MSIETIEVQVTEDIVIFPTKKAVSVLGEKPGEGSDFNRLFLSELREVAHLELGLKLEVPADAFDRLKKIANDILTGGIDNEPLKYQMMILAQTSGLNSTSWGNFKVALNMLLDSFEMLPQVAEVLESFTGTDQERLYAQDRMCVKAIFSQTLKQLQGEN